MHALLAGVVRSHTKSQIRDGIARHTPRTRATPVVGYADHMTPVTLSDLAERMRIRADVAAEHLQSADESSDLSLPPALGQLFWQIVYRECTIVKALVCGAPSGEAPRHAERASILLALKENTATDPVERAALQVVRHELQADLAAWRGERGRESHAPPATLSA